MDAPLPVCSAAEINSNRRKTSEGSRSGFAVLRVILSVLFLAAAGLKLVDESTGVAASVGPFVSLQWRTTAIGGEMLLGVWLLLGLAPRMLWLVALCFFSLLAGVSLYFGIAGEPSCGCFGTKLAVPPWYTVALDSGAVAALLCWAPVPFQTRNAIVWKGQLALVMAVGGYCIAGYWTMLQQEGTIIGNGPEVVLRPITWVGKRLPLLTYIETTENLNSGEWLLLLVHSDCTKCREVLLSFEQLAREKSVQGVPFRMVVIDLSPYGASNRPRAINRETVFKQGRLPQQKEWIAKTPILIKLVDGVVVETDDKGVRM